MATKTTSKTSSASSKSAPKAAASAPKAAAPAPAKAKAPYQPTQEEISARAYEIYEREGGNEQDNWFRAERELLAGGRK